MHIICFGSMGPWIAPAIGELHDNRERTAENLTASSERKAIRFWADGFFILNTRLLLERATVEFQISLDFFD